MTEAEVAHINDLILTYVSPWFLVALSMITAAAHTYLYWHTRKAQDMISVFSFMLVASAYLWIITNDPGGSPGRAVFRLTAAHLVANGLIQAVFRLPIIDVFTSIKSKLTAVVVRAG